MEWMLGAWGSGNPVGSRPQLVPYPWRNQRTHALHIPRQTSVLSHGPDFRLSRVYAPLGMSIAPRDLNSGADSSASPLLVRRGAAAARRNLCSILGSFKDGCALEDLRCVGFTCAKALGPSGNIRNPVLNYQSYLIHRPFLSRISS